MERFGFPPKQLPDYKGLRGDPSDNIIGISGIGEKTGAELIQKFGTIEGIYKALKKGDKELLEAGIKPRIVTLLREGEDEALFSKMLATIRLDAPIVYRRPGSPWKESFSSDDAVKLFTELEFKSLSVRIKNLFTHEGKSDEDEAKTPVDYMLGLTGDDEAVRKAELALWLLDPDKTTPSHEDVAIATDTNDAEAAYAKLRKDVEKEGLLFILDEIELPLIPIVRAASERGVGIDAAYLEDLSKDYHKKLSKAEREIYSHAGEEFNINSPKQLGTVLFDKLGLTAKGLKKTEGGARSTRESELEKLRDAHPIVDAILVYREYQKLLSTYIDNLPKMADEKGRIHTTFHQDGAATGRFSSSNPGLQNIPVREGLGEVIRDAFVAGRGRTFVSLDYSQIEMRVLAMLSEDPGLIEIFKNGEDIHTSVASRVFKVLPNDVTKEMRRRAKVINFGIIYGMGVTALKQNLGSTREEAQEFYDQYFVTFPKIGAYFDRVLADATKKGYTETMFGRKRYFPNLRSKIPFMKAMAERMAMNAPLQGTAADLVKIAMIRTDAALKKQGFGDDVALILQVHDELIFEMKDDEKIVSSATTIIKEAMEGVARGTKGEQVPLLVDTAKGKRWGSLK
jgi:DNA polymerase-1